MQSLSLKSILPDRVQARLKQMSRNWTRAWAGEFTPRVNSLPAVHQHLQKMGHKGILIGSMATNTFPIHHDIDILWIGGEKPEPTFNGLDWWLPCDQGYLNSSNHVLPFNLETNTADLAPGLYLFPKLINNYYQHRERQGIFPFPNERSLAEEYQLPVLDQAAKLLFLPNREWHTMSVLENGEKRLLSNVAFAEMSEKDLPIAPNIFSYPYTGKADCSYTFKPIPGLHRFLEQQLSQIPFFFIKDRIFFSEERDNPFNWLDLKVLGTFFDFSYWVTFAETQAERLTLDIAAPNDRFRTFFDRLDLHAISAKGRSDLPRREVCLEDQPSAVLQA